MYARAALPLLCLAPSVLAWGGLGHETIALIAQNFVSADTKAWAQKILNNKSETYLADVATWADTYRRQKGGTFSAPFHFLDAEDSPPKSCNVDYERDCGKSGCIVSAIQNYTTRVQSTSLPAGERTNALKFLVHFLGDVSQPLHNEALDVGGNSINVTYANRRTNLHSIWDTQMPEQIVGGGSLADAQAWAASLSNDIKSGAYKGQASEWLAGMNIKDPVSSALVWSTDANTFVCSEVLPGGVSSVQKDDLSGAYFKSVEDTIQLQIAKAGYRLAGWLNLLATGQVGLKKRDEIFAAIPLPRTPGLGNEFSAAKLARREFGYDCRH